MKSKRILKHSIYHRGLEAHSIWVPKTENEVALLFKSAALFTRGIVVPDSDLNNHPVLSELRGRENVLASGIATGFIRRAARYVNDQNGNLLSQSELFEQYSKNYPKLAEKIPSEHPKLLNSLFESAERDLSPPIWKVKDAASLFADRMLFEFKRARLSKRAKEIVKTQIRPHIERMRPTIEKLRGAELARECLPDHETDHDQQRLWELLQKAYSGNLLASFKGELSIVETSKGDSSMIPAGPVSNQSEDLLTEGYYESAKLGKFEQLYSIGIGQASPAKSSPSFVLDLEKLMELSIPEIEELREKAEPDRYFNLRFRALGNGASAKLLKDKLTIERNLYWERLAKAGLVLTNRALTLAKKHFQDVYITEEIKREQRQVEEDGRKFVAQFTPAEILIFGLDLLSLSKRNREVAKAKIREGDFYKAKKAEAQWLFQNGVLKRPDFRIVKKMAKEE